MEVRIEEWHGMNIRFVNVDGEWWCVYDDIISIIKKFNTGYCSHFERDLIDHKNLIRGIDLDGESVLIVNELGIYEIFYLCDGMLETVNFRHWSGEIMAKLRSKYGLQQYEVLQMLDDDVQQDISRMIDTLYWDDEKKILMQSVTVQGGDVEQIPFME